MSKFEAWLEERVLPPDLWELIRNYTLKRLQWTRTEVWFGVADLIETNSRPYFDLVEAQLLVVGSGSNGDYIAIDYGSGNGACGWLPMAMIGG